MALSSERLVVIEETLSTKTAARAFRPISPNLECGEARLGKRPRFVEALWQAVGQAFHPGAAELATTSSGWPSSPSGEWFVGVRYLTGARGNGRYDQTLSC